MKLQLLAASAIASQAAFSKRARSLPQRQDPSRWRSSG